jgi:hypothetical protein
MDGPRDSFTGTLDFIEEMIQKSKWKRGRCLYLQRLALMIVTAHGGYSPRSWFDAAMA